MVVKKFNYYRFFCFIVILLTIIFGVIYLIKNNNYKNSYEYKFLNIGYSLDEIKIINEKLDDSKKNELLTIKYNSDICYFLKEKYFIYSYLNDYLEYKNKNKKYEYSRVVSIINSEANIEWIDEERETDISKNELMLVNRLYGLNKDYIPENIVDIPTQYAYSGKKISKSILDKIINLIDAAKDNGYTFVVSDGYRSYDEQKRLYDSYSNNYGRSEADEIVAMPGHSDYQTGLAFDLSPYGKTYDNPKESEEYKWLYANAYKYGFIFRLPSDKTELTQFNPSTWRLRYVGVDVATLMKSENICFEEYYAYFVNNR